MLCLSRESLPVALYALSLGFCCMRHHFGLSARTLHSVCANVTMLHEALHTCLQGHTAHQISRGECRGFPGEMRHGCLPTAADGALCSLALAVPPGYPCMVISHYLRVAEEVQCTLSSA
jgi:hypothetical protein